MNYKLISFHSVSHYLYLENVADLIKKDGFLGTIHLLKEMEEGKNFGELCEYAFKKMEISIVNGSIKSAMEGEFGNFQFTQRTKNSKLFINPLMTLYWCFNLKSISKNLYCLKELQQVKFPHQITNAIFGNRNNIRKNQSIPL